MIKQSKEKKEPKCKKGAHAFGKDFDPRYKKCQNCNFTKVNLGRV